MGSQAVPGLLEGQLHLDSFCRTAAPLLGMCAGQDDPSPPFSACLDPSPLGCLKVTDLKESGAEAVGAFFFFFRMCILAMCLHEEEQPQQILSCCSNTAGVWTVAKLVRNFTLLPWINSNLKGWMGFSGPR